MLLASGISAVYAQESEPFEQILIVSSTDGKTTEYRLEERPVLSFDNTDLIIKTSQITVNTPVSELKGISYGKRLSGITSPETDGCILSYVDNLLMLSNPGRDCALQVFALDGVILLSEQCTAVGSASVSLAGLPAGVYIAHAADKSIKIIKQ